MGLPEDWDLGVIVRLGMGEMLRWMEGLGRLGRPWKGFLEDTFGAGEAVPDSTGMLTGGLAVP